MKNLQREYLRVQDLSEKLGGEFLYSDKYKKDREWWVLGSFFNLLRASDEYCDILADEQEAPDFKLKYVSRGNNYNVEVCEILHPGRKRGDEKEIPFDEDLFLKNVIEKKIDIWETFKATLKKKLTKDYGNNSWLLIYHNIPVYHISQYGFWINLVCANVEVWIKQDIINIQKSKFEQIFVINSSVKEIISIHPKFKVLFSKYESYFIC
jgi:hypothetical protein